MTATNTEASIPRPRGGFQAPVPDDVLAVPTETAAAYARHIERTGLAPRSIKEYVNQVRRFAEWLEDENRGRLHHNPVETFTDPHSRDYAVRNYRSYLMTEKGLAASSIDTALSALDSFYGWIGLGKAKIERTKARNSEQFGDGLEPPQVQALLRAARARTKPDRHGNATDPWGVRDYAIIGLFVFTGIRLSELAGVNDLDWTASERGGNITIRGKGSKIRKVPLQVAVRPLMLEWRVERQQLGFARDLQPFFITRQGTRLATRSISHMVGLVGQEASIPDLHPHTLRHTFALSRLRAGDTVADVQALLGHASIETTMIYTKPTAAQVAEKADAWKVEW